MRKLTKKKKIIFVIIAAIMIIASASGLYFITSGRDKPPTLQEVVSEKFAAYETDLLDSLGSMESNQDVARYLVSWAENKGIRCTQDIVGNVIYNINAADGYEDADPVFIVCGFDGENMQEYVRTIAVALTAARNPQNNGPFLVAFCPESDGRYYGIENIAASYFDDNARVLYLDHSAEKKISAITGGFNYFSITDDIEYHKTEYDTAYTISIRNVPSFLVSENVDDTPNPIKVLGQLIADFQANSLIFQLADFHGGTNPAITPAEAEMTIVIDSSYIDKFEKKMNDSIEKFTGKYGEKFPQIEYTFVPAEVPSQVLEEETANNIVGFMYTVIDGVYSRDMSGNVTALTNMGRISSSGASLQIDVTSMSFDEDILAEIRSAYQIISGLCDVNFSMEDEQSVFDGGEKSDILLENFSATYEDFAAGSLDYVSVAEFTPCTFLAQKNNNASVLYCGIDEKNKEDFAGALIAFICTESTEE